MKKVLVLILFLFLITACGVFENKYYDENVDLPKYEKIVNPTSKQENTCEENGNLNGNKSIFIHSYCYADNNYQKYLNYLKRENISFSEERGGWNSFTFVNNNYDKYYSIVKDYKVIGELLIKGDKVVIQTYIDDYVIDANVKKMNGAVTINDLMIYDAVFDNESQSIKIRYKTINDISNILKTITVIYEGQPIKAEVDYKDNEIILYRFDREIDATKLDKIVFTDMKYRYEYIM